MYWDVYLYVVNIHREIFLSIFSVHFVYLLQVWPALSNRYKYLKSWYIFIVLCTYIVAVGSVRHAVRQLELYIYTYNRRRLAFPVIFTSYLSADRELFIWQSLCGKRSHIYIYIYIYWNLIFYGSNLLCFFFF